MLKITVFVYFVEDLKAQVLTPTIQQQLGAILESHPALVVLGQSCQAKAALVNTLLGEAILPQGGSSWRWVRFLYGLSSHIAITLSSDFEVVEDLQSHDKTWTVVPEEDLKRSEAEEKVNIICHGMWSSGMLHCALGLIDPSVLMEHIAFISKGGGVHFNKTGFNRVILFFSVVLQIFANITSCKYSFKKY